MYNLYVSFVITKKFLFFTSRKISAAFVLSERMPASQNDMLGLAAYLAKNIAKMKDNREELVIINIIQMGKTDPKLVERKKNAH